MERWQPRIAALVSLLLHLLVALIVMLTPPVVVSSGSSAAGGSRVEVQYIGETPPSPAPRPADRPASDDAPATPPPAASRLQTTPVPEAEATLPLVVDTPAEAPTPPRIPQPAPRPTPAPAPPAQPPPTQRPAALRGQPPGMRLEDLAPVNAGPAPSAAMGSGRRQQTSGDEGSLEVDGYQVIYDLRGERRLREWRDAGMTELSLPLPGTRRLMVCPLETALRRGSGPCRMVEPNDPALADIGDAREVLDMNQVYRLGELLWRGPRPYR